MRRGLFILEKMMDKNTIINTFFESKKNANCVLDLEKSLLSNDVNCILASIDIVKDLFTEIFNRNMLHINPELGKNEEKYTSWLIDRYNDFTSHLISYLCHDDATIQAKSLDVLMTFVVLEGEKPLKNIKKNEWHFPRELFERIIGEMASQDIDQQVLIMKFQKYTTYDDVKMYLLKGLLKKFQHAEKVTDVFLVNSFYLLASLKYPTHFPSADELIDATPNTLLSQHGIQTPFHLQQKLFCKLFSSVWLQFLKFQLPLPVLKKVLSVLDKKIIPYLQNPCLMTDFLTDAYKRGGLTSLLALNGLFFLMDKYNVEYPDFFLQLYSLFDENIVNGKFSARFFYLSDLFLSSTHLPAYIVAAFAKKLSRIALTSKTENLLIIIPFVCNLLIRHPTLNTLIHRIEPSEVSEDPYNFTAVDPAKSKALDSALWEIKSLQNHVNPDVSRKAKLINHPLPVIENDLPTILDESVDDLFRKERKRKFIGVPVAVQKAPKLDNWWIMSNKCIS